MSAAIENPTGSATAGRRLETLSGAAMDRRVDRKRLPRAVKLGAGAALLAGAVVAVVVLRPGAGRTLRVDGSLVTVSTVARGVFEDFIPVRGRVKPLRTVYLDAVDGGRVERIHVEDGAQVQAGQLLVELSNAAIQLDVVSREAQVIEQLNQLRIIELNLENARLQHQREIAELEYQATRAGRQLERQRRLHDQGYTAEAELVDTQDEHDSILRRLEISRESSRSEDQLRTTQLAELKRGTQQLQRNLGIARASLEALAIRAPVSGQLTAFRLEVGQSLARGERLGQIDDPASYKLVAGIDEYYLARVEVGESATLEWTGKTYALRVAKTYPQVRDGQFEADLVFAGEQPTGIRRGQTLQAKLTFGEAGADQLMVRNGAFYQDTGGSWAFVVSPDGSQAVRRTVRLGRRNNDYIEVLDGLAAGEKIVTSPYTGFLDKDRLQLQAASE